MIYGTLKINALIIFAVILLPSYAISGWVGPVEIVKTTWGKKNSEVGFEHSQYGDGGGGLLGVSRNGLIVVGDAANCRVNIYNSKGSFLQNVYPKLIECPEFLGWPEYLQIGNDGFVVLGDKFQKYDFNGKLVFSIDTPGFIDYVIGPTGKIYYQTAKNTYRIYSSSGELLAADYHNPLELGIKTVRYRDNKYDTTVQYADMTYHMVLDGDWENYFRDQNNYLYFYHTYTAQDPVSGQPSSTSLVVKYNQCGKKIGRLDLPISEYEKPTQEELSMPTTQLTVRNEYGPPVIGPDGSVYTYKFTLDTYSVVKWEWVGDSKNDCSR